MWYVVDIVFAQKARRKGRKVKCELCCVLFEASTALDACRKAMPWAKEHSTDTSFRFLGIQHVRSLDDERPGDGTEIGGRFFDEIDPWGRKDEIIPDLNKSGSMFLEANSDVPIGQFLSPEQIEELRNLLGDHHA